MGFDDVPRDRPRTAGRRGKLELSLHVAEGCGAIGCVPLRFTTGGAELAHGQSECRSGERLLATEPDVYYLTEHYVGYPSILVRLSRVSRDSLQNLLASAAVEIGEKKREAQDSAGRLTDDSPRDVRHRRHARRFHTRRLAALRARRA